VSTTFVRNYFSDVVIINYKIKIPPKFRDQLKYITTKGIFLNAE